MQNYYKSPLTIYVVWHPLNEEGMQYAEALYNTFCRDTDSPLTRGLGIPVRFRYAASDSGLPLDIDTSLSDRNAIVLLADVEMQLDESWFGYVQALLDKESNNTRLLPVALSKNAFAIDEKRLGTKQFIKLFDIKDVDGGSSFAARAAELKSRLLHEFSRMFFGMNKVADEEQIQSSPPIKLFISHAKVDQQEPDGEGLAEQFKTYVLQHKKLNTFFDTNDIRDADDFAQVLIQSIKSSAVVVFLTDRYSTREWCRIEVIVAKRFKSPLVVVNNLKSGERRSFPYLGNVPTLQYRPGCFDQVIDLALFQVLNNLYLEEKLKKEIELYDLDGRYKTVAIQNAPELFNFIDIKMLQGQQDGRKVLVLYPDPPLGTEELRVLNDLDPDIAFITPSLIHKLPNP